MGQTESFDSFPEALKHYRDSIGRQAKIYKIMLLLSRKEFYHKLSHFNRLCNTVPSPRRKLICIVHSDSDSSILWKLTVRIACMRVGVRTHEPNSIILITLGQFLRCFEALADETASRIRHKLNKRMQARIESVLNEAFRARVKDEAFLECCICLERKPEEWLPCTHSYCRTCINQWKAESNTCPLCRVTITNNFEEWLLAATSKSAEITEHSARSMKDRGVDKIS